MSLPLVILVAYPKDATLPLDVVLAVRLMDISVTGGRVIAESMFAPAGQPIVFQLSYDPVQGDALHIYEVRATPTANGVLLLHTRKPYRVLTREAPQSVPLRLQEITSGAPVAKVLTVEDTRWKPVLLGLPVEQDNAQPHMTLRKGKFTAWTGGNTLSAT